MIPTISEECSEFLTLSKGQPLTRFLKKEGNGLRRIKVRWKKSKLWESEFIHTFNSSFPQYKDILHRSVLASKNPDVSEMNEDEEPFFIFPINNFKFCYNPNITNITKTYEKLYENLNDFFSEESVNIFHDLIRTGYVFSELDEGIEKNSQVIIYNIPYYYALRASLVPDYRDIIYGDKFA